MSGRLQLRCVVIGESTLLTRCLHLLQDRGHHIRAVVSPNSPVPDCPWFRTLAAARGCLNERPDVLFSIVNREILGHEQLQWPLLGAINYHDAPLPRYAGIHATSAAILAGETAHGITWHRMTRQLDAGDILIQRRFPISPADTALSLNAKCQEEAIQGFHELLERLESGTLEGRPQDLSQRTVVTMADRLAHNGFLQWHEPAENIERQLRASACYPYENTFGTPAILLPAARSVRIHSATITPDAVPHKPGTVLEAGPGRLQVALRNGVMSARLADQMFPECVSEAELQPLCGQCLPDPTEVVHSDAFRTAIDGLRQESRHIVAVQHLPAPLRVAGMRAEKFFEQAGRTHDFTLEIADAQLPSLLNRIAQMLLRLAALTAQPRATATVLRPAIPGFLPLSPFVVSADSLIETRDNLVAACDTAPLSDDVFLRYPDLSAQMTTFANLQVRICVHGAVPESSRGLSLECTATGIIGRFAADEITSEGAAGLWKDLRSEAPAQGAQQQAEFVSVCDLISRRAADTPDAIAVESERGTLSYGELEATSTRLAAALRQRGAGAEVRVSLLLAPSPDYCLALIGVLKSGAAFVPLDVAAPARRNHRILRDCSPLLVIADPEQRRACQGVGMPVVTLEELLATAETQAPTVTPTADDLAYMLYTSGSTGQPKGVMIEHQSLAWFIEQDLHYHRTTTSDRILQLCSPAFDASIEEYFSAFCAGATLVLRPTRLLESAENFLEETERRQLTITGVYPALIEPMLRVMEERRYFPASVRVITTGGEPIPMALVMRWRKFFSDQRRQPPALINVYGLTESTVANFFCNLSTTGQPDSAAPIGLPLPGNQWMLDDGGKRHGNSSQGELLLGGVQVARGYHRQPVQNATRFFRDSVTGERWLRTGDRVERLPDGQLACLGRVDSQVKISGVRVEREEVERVLLETPGVSNVAVYFSDGGPAGPRLVAVASPAAEELAGELRQQAARHLPAAMRPSRIALVPEFPLTLNGKIDRDQLWQRVGPEEKPQFLMEASDITTRVWCQILGAERTTDSDPDFLQQGGDSLAALRLLLEIETATGVQIPLSAFLQTPTLEGLRRLVRQPPRQMLQPLQDRGHGLPLCFVHGVSGDITEHLVLAELLADQHPGFGIRSRAAFDREHRPTSIEATAEESFEVLRKHHSGGRFAVVGFSWGGLVAWELARLCQQHYGTAPLVVMLDSGFPTDVPASAAEKLIHLLTHLPDAVGRWTAARRFQTQVETEGEPAKVDPESLREHFIRIGTKYRPAAFPGVHLHMIKALITDLGPRAWNFSQRLRDNGWGVMTGCPVTIDTRRCRHMDLISRPVVEWTAERVTAACQSGREQRR